MNSSQITNPFKIDFLSDFILVKDKLLFENDELSNLDKLLSSYERAFLDPDIESSLFVKNEILASFAISKAENSQLTLKEANSVYKLVKDNPDYDFIKNQLENNKKLSRKDYEKMEFFNIVKTFRYINTLSIEINQFNADIIIDIHDRLTKGLDIFNEHLQGFDVYKSGSYRDNDSIRVGSYVPVENTIISDVVDDLVKWLKNDFTVQNIAIFHTSLYAIHPFNNGNKRVCRIIEHLLLRILGFNALNLYSTSYYYHKQKDRYYKYLLASLDRKHFNYFSNFILEAISLSIAGVIKTSIEFQRQHEVNSYNLDSKSKFIAYKLIKYKELRFKRLFKYVKNKMSRQTFVDRLELLIDLKVVNKREDGRKVFYSLNFNIDEEEYYKKQYLDVIKKNIKVIPSEFLSIV